MASDTLIDFLGNGQHPVILEQRISEQNDLFKKLREGFVFIRFTDTKGETELGVNLIPSECNLEDLFKEKSKKAHLVGTCELNFVPVKCVVEVDLDNRAGLASLEVLNR